eukprot:TRINITY_DN3077_c2_g1_i1.p1 TRINITY_DN3077_c2_g1~~TRINITY_DN3077_c2_g1_i1.p1  ORF type:complete len:1577 (+),score=524.46 TRINITY_DN3077_c2_g1_i1:102-4832(+)
MSGEYQRLATDDLQEEADLVPQEEAAGLLSKMLFNWVTPMVEQGYKQALQVPDLLRLIQGDKSASLARRWDKSWDHEMSLSKSWNGFIGKRVQDDDGNEGVLKWIGRLPYSVNPDSYYAGVAWDDVRRADLGDTCIGGDGWFYGEQIFECEDGHGSFIKPHLLKIKGAPSQPTPPKTPFVAYGLSGAFLGELAVAGMYKLGNDITVFAGPLALQAIVRFLQKDDPEWSEGIIIVAILFVSQVIQSLCANQYFYLVGRVGMRMRQALSCAVFDKALNLNEKTRAHPDLDIGRIVNMMSTDSQRAQDVIQSIHQLWSAPFQIIVSCILLFRLVGVSLFAGIGVMLLATPIQGKMMKKMMSVRADMAKFTDQRVKAVTEVLSGIRIVKFMVWTARFASKLNDIRDSEVDKLATQQNYRVLMFFIIYLTPLFLTASTFIVYAASGGNIDAETVFPAIALFSILRFPFLVLPMQFNMMVNAKVSFDRLTLFLESKTSKDEGIEIQPLEASQDECAFVLEDCTFHAYEHQTIPELAIKEQQLAPENREQAHGDIQETTVDMRPSPGKANKPAASKFKKYKLVPKDVLTDVDLKIRKNKLTMIVGKTGSGKTCLLEAMLGSVDASKGTVRRVGEFSHGIFIPESVAYAPQQAWIMNTTLKNNILFFNEDDDDLYDETVVASQLSADLLQLQDGDQTEIGEKGINLSGGQKQRVSIARSVYARKDIILLDDPLSAVDPHVGKELMKQVIGSTAHAKPGDWPEAKLDDKTRILVTHQMQFLKHADDVVFMKDGRVAKHFIGTPEQSVIDQILMFKGDGAEFFTPVHEAAKLEEMDAEPTVTPPLSTKANDKPKSPAHKSKGKDAGKLTTTEERAQGRVKTHMYLSYIHAAGGWKWFAIVMMLFCLNQGLLQICDLWLTWWTDSTSDGSSSSGSDADVIGGDLSTMEHLYIYVGLIMATSLANLARGFTVYSRFQVASRKFHKLLLANVLRAPMAFFDTTPLGRLINRFSKDIDQVDIVLPPTVITFFQLTLACLAYLIIIATSQPVILGLFVPASVIYVSVLKKFIRSNRETKRLDSISKSPIFQHFTETLNGMKTIHSYEVTTQFRDENRNRLDLNTRTSFSNLACNRWLAIRLELLGNIICCSTALMAVVTKKSGLSNSSSTGLLSLGITYSLNLTGQLNFLVRQVADLEAQMNGVERIVEFTEEIEQEPVLDYTNSTPDDELIIRGKQLLHNTDDRLAIVRDINPSGTVQAYVPTEDKQVEMTVKKGEYSRTTAPDLVKGWPANGEVVFKNVTFRYRPGLPLVLKGLGGESGLVIQNRDKVGIVGRTGAGKSTLMLALFRFVEIAGGSISIGGRDIRTVRLDDLRSSLSMIPQDPVLFQGSVRSNLDPFDANKDSEIWDRLKQVSLTDRIERHDDQLDGTVVEGGQNFSVGQRQLLCMARALLKKNSKILLMDEATASIDHATDMAIQVTVREQFKDYTVLTVAHRLQTIMDSTKIMVLDQGVCAEYDSPKNLLANPDGILHDMAQKTGDFERLQAISEGRLNFVDALQALEDEKNNVALCAVLIGGAAAALKVVRRKQSVF